MEALQERNIPVRHIMGTSAGAMFAFYMATKCNIEDLKKLLYAEPGPLGYFKWILDYVEPEERRKQFN